MVNFFGIETSCSKCHLSFPLRSKLHKHIKAGYVKEALPSSSTQLSSSIPVVASMAVHQSFGLGLAFRGWTYTTTVITLNPHRLPQDADPESIAHLNTGCGVTAIDKSWLLRQLPGQKISTMSTPLTVKGIKTSKHECEKFAAPSLYFSGKNGARKLVYAFVRCEIHLVEGLRANLLIGNDIISPENFVINIEKKSTLIGSYGVTIPISARQRGQFLTRKILTREVSVVPPRSEAMIPLVLISVPDDRDFLFHPIAQPNLTLFTHIINHYTSKILVRNAFDQPLHISHWHKLGHLINTAYDNCFFTKKRTAIDLATFSPSSQSLSDFSARPPLCQIDSLLETVLDNGVKVYGDAAAVEQIAELVVEYPTIWESQGFVQIPPERWMTVPLKPGWESKVSAIKPKVYPLGNETRHVVDNTFDEMHGQSHLKYITDPTPFSFPVFVVYKTDSQGKKKGRAVIDIQKLNDLVLPDSYPLSLQSEIIANVQGCTNLAILYAASFFYQWLLHLDHRFMFTVVMHRSQETF